MDTFWYIDPQKGVDGVWDNSLASKADLQRRLHAMTVKLRKGIFWSDGGEFTADDVVYTIPDAHEDHVPALECAGASERRRRLGARSANRRLQAQEGQLALHSPCSRCAGTRCGMMPKHVFEKAGDPLKFAFDPR